MAEGAENKDDLRVPGSVAPDFSGLNIAFNSGSDEARAFLREQQIVAKKQAEILDLQIEDLKREDGVRHWSLRVRHISDVLKMSFELAVAVIGLAIVAFIASAVWSAAEDHGLVVEAFQVPPDLAARGLSGQVVAAQLLDKLTALQNATISARPIQSYANNWGNDIKVQIPDTGVSIGEFNQYLHAWLGHETRIDGEIFRTASGITVTARTGGDSGASFSGPESSLDSLLEKAAEHIYRQTQPYRYAMYRMGLGTTSTVSPADWNEARRVLTQLTFNPDREEGAWAWIGLSNIARYDDADSRLGEVDLRKAHSADPDFKDVFENFVSIEIDLGHSEAALAFGKIAENGNDENRNRFASVLFQLNVVSVDQLTGDYSAAIADSERGLDLPDLFGSAETFRESILDAQAFAHDRRSDLAYLQSMPSLPSSDAEDRTNRQEAIFIMHAALEDWQAVAREEAPVENAQRDAFPGYDNASINATYYRWRLALATSELGDEPGAEAIIASTPLDCYDCVRARGSIAAVAHRWGAASFWFADAVMQGPSIPFAYTDWGAMLLAKGDLDGAIAKFKSANQKGPHFADPLEMWGEALIRQNRSDLAVVKFAEANKYAPNWGRLHLKWGEALLWTGKTDDAQKQFAHAAALELTPSETSELAHMRSMHG